MKRSDIVTIVLVALIGVFATYFLGKLVVGDPKEASASFKVIEPITADLVSPDSEVFNEDAINPTVEVFVGSCRDLDQNGVIDDVERESCNKNTSETENIETPENISEGE